MKFQLLIRAIIVLFLFSALYQTSFGQHYVDHGLRIDFRWVDEYDIKTKTWKENVSYYRNNYKYRIRLSIRNAYCRSSEPLVVNCNNQVWDGNISDVEIILEIPPAIWPNGVKVKQKHEFYKSPDSLPSDGWAFWPSKTFTYVGAKVPIKSVPVKIRSSHKVFKEVSGPTNTAYIH